MEATRQLQRDGDKGSATRAVWRWTKAIQGAETGIGRFRGERPSYLDSIIWSVEKSLPSTSPLNIPFWPLGPWAPEPCSYHFRPTLSWTHEPWVPPAHSKLKGASVCAAQARVTGAAPLAIRSSYFLDGEHVMTAAMRKSVCPCSTLSFRSYCAGT
ncbi:hypothetical protein EDB84DRAFT_1445022 [Lactarius hengduanensis]|nr:hypothetical protein EDB84DRAFT_1445022 [Lactarius hengduanensis]